MSFLSQLAKGFVRSAVNQVGRDGGKVVSNKVYKDRHSTPIRVVSNQQPQNVNLNQAPNLTLERPTIASQSQITGNRSELMAKGYEPEPLYGSFIIYFFLLIGASILIFIGPIYFLIKGVIYLTKEHTTFHFYSEEPVYATDRRYKSGQRLEGYQRLKTNEKLNLSATPEERSGYKTKGVISLLVFATFVSFYVFAFTSSNAETLEDQSPVTDEIIAPSAIITANSGLNLRSEGDPSARIVLNIPKGDTVKIKQNANGWYQVTYQEQEGWVSGKFIELIE